MLLNEYGDIVMKCWDTIVGHFYNVKIDEVIVMPNHIHGIVSLSNVGAQFIAPDVMIAPAVVDCPVSGRSVTNQNNKEGVINQGVINHAPTVGGIVRAFKARCTYMINHMRKAQGAPVWQRNYYEHIIRDEQELYAICEYIRYNPLKWEEDEENPNKKRAI